MNRDEPTFNRFGPGATRRGAAPTLRSRGGIILMHSKVPNSILQLLQLKIYRVVPPPPKDAPAADLKEDYSGKKIFHFRMNRDEPTFNRTGPGATRRGVAPTL